MLNLLLESTTSDGTGSWMQWVILLVLVAVFVVMFWFTGRSNKKRQAEQQKILDAVAPGNKVTTIGGVSGIVVEVDEDSFVLQTGSESSGKCYIRFTKQAIYQTDAKAPDEKKADKKNEEEALQVEENKEQETPKAEETSKTEE